MFDARTACEVQKHSTLGGSHGLRNLGTRPLQLGQYIAIWLLALIILPKKRRRSLEEERVTATMSEGILRGTLFLLYLRPT